MKNSKKYAQNQKFFFAVFKCVVDKIDENIISDEIEKHMTQT